MTTVHSTGPYTEPIIISDEEDAAFVENELSRWTPTDSSHSSSNTPTYSPTHGTHKLYFAPADSLFPSTTSSATAPLSVPLPAVPLLSGQKRKWTDMRDSSISSPQVHLPSEQPSGNKKKKRQRKERQQRKATSSTATDSQQRSQNHGHNHSVANDSTAHTPTGDYASPYYSGQPHDYQDYGVSYSWPVDTYQVVGSSHFSPEDEYRPTDGPLWDPSERPPRLSALAVPWYPSYTSTSHPAPESSFLSPQLPSPVDQDRPEQSPTSAYIPEPEPQSSDTPQACYSPHFEQPFDPSLSERLRQLEAFSASLMALASGSSNLQGAVASVNSVPTSTTRPRQELPPIHKLSDSPPLPPPPQVRPQAEPLKRLMGIPDDKGNHGYFDLTAPNLDPPAPSAPIPPVAEFTLVMAHLPKKYRKIDFVNSWAKRSGTPVRVVLDSKSGKALVEWVDSRCADNAFSGLRLRGDGREHIRVYRYRGAKPPPAPPSSLPGKEIEEGEIEEGEVVQVGVKSRKKKNKGKKKAMQLEQRLNGSALIPPALVHRLPPPPFVHILGLDSVGVGASSSGSSTATAAAAPTPRLPLMERFTDPPPPVLAPREDSWEEEMELDSDDEGGQSTPPLAVIPLVPCGSNVDEEDMDLEDEVDGVGAEDADVEDGDMDMEMSSVSEGSPQPPLLRTPTSPVPATAPVDPPSSGSHEDEPTQPVAPPPSELVAVERDDAAVKEARRHKLEAAIARTKAELAMRAAATSSRISLVSSTGSSESPEPMTPLDSPTSNLARVTIASVSHAEAIVSETKESAVDAVVIKTESTTVNLDDLASTFISETIHAARSSSPASFSTTATSQPSVNIIPSTAAPLSVAVPVPISAQGTSALVPSSVTIPLSEEQRHIKQKRWLELVSTSKALFGKIAAVKTKEEKDLLMRLLRAKTKAADEVKREIDSGVVVVQVSIPASAPAPAPATLPSPTSMTPTPVPSSRVPSATPTPMSTPAPTAPKRKTSSTATFRWPDTPREIIILMSDDESD